MRFFLETYSSYSSVCDGRVYLCSVFVGRSVVGRGRYIRHGGRSMCTDLFMMTFWCNGSLCAGL